MVANRGEGEEPTGYSLGHSDRELERLRIQARFIEPITRRFFTDAGIGPGMRVLDVGSGAGDVAFLVADLVGATGTVVGTDRSEGALVTARQRAEALGLTNTTFRDGDPTQLDFDGEFDAVVGRYVLMFQRDPTTLLRGVVKHVRHGGVVVFHEPYRGGIRSFPEVPTYDQAWELVDETFRRSGADPLMGLKLHSTFLAAGLSAPSMRLEAAIAGAPACSDHAHFEMDVAVTLVPEMERLGVATAKDVDAPTLVDRVLDEVAVTQSVIIGRIEVGAWCTTA